MSIQDLAIRLAVLREKRLSSIHLTRTAKCPDYNLDCDTKLGLISCAEEKHVRCPLIDYREDES